MLKHVKKLWTGQEGQGMAEYGLILALVAVVVIGALRTLGTGIGAKMDEVSAELTP
ncbi:Flp family type IVb pilin [Tepidanaerobacter sp. GT38]|uniref:Flp family type IVb pilin n=1 Tax=Tepidanaerobacter sp. GT38 TaxID=2722793 RepID=UPI001F45FAE2|nr:Flp family type IVb pilin [Tepidanaerobacter sp. GT38]MCG1011541.1 Flp family type IVb pilin [Tepidanaerobacter sp. GT38]